jgi:hypothetical protein
MDEQPLLPATAQEVMGPSALKTPRKSGRKKKQKRNFTPQATVEAAPLIPAEDPPAAMINPAPAPEVAPEQPSERPMTPPMEIPERTRARLMATIRDCQSTEYGPFTERHRDYYLQLVNTMTETKIRQMLFLTLMPGLPKQPWHPQFYSHIANTLTVEEVKQMLLLTLMPRNKPAEAETNSREEQIAQAPSEQTSSSSCSFRASYGDEL